MTIEPVVDTVFIHVSDMPAAVAWYTALLGIEPGTTSHEDRIHQLPLEGHTGILLDAHPGKAPAAGAGPRLMFATDDLAAALVKAKSISATVTEPEDIGSALVFYVEDPDRNLICIIQRKAAGI